MNSWLTYTRNFEPDDLKWNTYHIFDTWKNREEIHKLNHVIAKLPKKPTTWKHTIHAYIYPWIPSTVCMCVGTSKGKRKHLLVIIRNHTIQEIQHIFFPYGPGNVTSLQCSTLAISGLQPCAHAEWAREWRAHKLSRS
jgi:hypothetical protein